LYINIGVHRIIKFIINKEWHFADDDDAIRESEARAAEVITSQEGEEERDHDVTYKTERAVDDVTHGGQTEWADVGTVGAEERGLAQRAGAGAWSSGKSSRRDVLINRRQLYNLTVSTIFQNTQ